MPEDSGQLVIEHLGPNLKAPTCCSRLGPGPLNGDLGATFRNWYPALSLKNQSGTDNLLAA